MIGALFAVLFGIQGSASSCDVVSSKHRVVVDRVIAAVNSGSPARILQAASHWSQGDTSPGVRSRVLNQLGLEHWKSRSWRTERTCGAGAQAVYVLAENALSQETDSIAVTFNEHDEIVRFTVVAGVRIHVETGETENDAARIGALRRYLKRFGDAGVFAGVVLVQRDTVVLLTDSVGSESAAGARPIAVDCRINIASVGKLFTATAIMQLVARGALSLDDSLGGILPDSMVAPPLRAVRIRHLLAHTSGIRNSRDSVYAPSGAQYFYSNLDYVILGEVLEHVSGERFENYFAEHLFRPAGMTRTTRAVFTKPVDYLAMGYVPEFTESGIRLNANPLLHTLPGNTAGALFSSASDLARFAYSLMTGRLLPEALVDSMRTPQNGSATSPYGFGVMRWRAPVIWGHAGDLPGTDADLEVFEPTGVISIVLSIYSGVNNPIRRRIARLWGITAR